MLQKGKWGVEGKKKAKEAEQADKCSETFKHPKEQQFWENLIYSHETRKMKSLE